MLGHYTTGLTSAEGASYKKSLRNARRAAELRRAAVGPRRLPSHRPEGVAAGTGGVLGTHSSAGRNATAPAAANAHAQV
jgi:hypothetical protein